MSSTAKDVDFERGWTNKFASASAQEQAIMTRIENPETRAALRESLANRRRRDDADGLLANLLFLYTLTHSNPNANQQPDLVVVDSKQEALDLLAAANAKNQQYLARREKQTSEGSKGSFFKRGKTN